MKISMSLLKNIWLFGIVILMMLGRGLPMWLLVILIVLALAAPLLREFSAKTVLDERQRFIGHFSSHIAFYVFIGLILFVMLNNFVSKGENPDPEWYMLLIIPLVIKLFISIFQNYGLKPAAQGIGYFFSGIWLLFVIFSHGFQPGSLMGAIPFLLMALVSWYSGKKPLIGGIGFLILSVGLMIFFGGWMKFDLYVRMLMYSLIPLPLLLSGSALLLSVYLKEE